jgi:hypothetical protein
VAAKRNSAHTPTATIPGGEGVKRAVHRFHLIAIAGLSWLSQSAVAFGEEASSIDFSTCKSNPTATDTEGAKSAFREGQRFFSEGAYNEAAALLTQAYSMDCTAHPLLLNLAMAHELFGRPEDAIAALELFNQRAPGSPYVAPNRRRIARLRLALQTPPEPIAPPAALDCPAVPPPATPPVARTAPPSDEIGWSSLALGVAGTGALATVIGGTVYLESKRSVSRAAERCGGTPGQCPLPAIALEGERARSRAQTAGWVAGAGLTAVAGGLLWHLLSRHDNSPEVAGQATSNSERLGWSAVVTRDAAQLGLRGRF